MADRKISDLTALTTPASGDYLPIVDISETAASSKNKRITIEELFRGVPAGTAAAPSIAIEGDEDTGIYSPGANQLALSTNGTGRLFVDAAGLVGIGTSSPDERLTLGAAGKLKLNRSDNATGATIHNGGGLEGLIFNELNSEGYKFQNNGTTVLRIDSLNRVGIGTTSPATALHVVTSGAGEIRHADGTRAISMGSTGSVSYVGSITAGQDLALYAANGERARIDSSGRLLVGTSSARSNFFNSGASSAGFQIEGSTDNTRRAAIIASGNDAYGAELILAKQKSGTIGGNTIVANNDSIGDIVFQGSDGSEFVQGARIEAFVDGTPGANDMPGRLVFSVTADGSASPTEALRISSNRAITVSDGGHIVLGTGTGTKIGTATTQKLGFYNATPVVQPAAVADATDAATVITQLNDLLAKLRTLGIIAT